MSTTLTTPKPNSISSSLNWLAKMITPNADQGVGTRASYVGNLFHLSNLTGRETIQISALGLYRCFINNKQVGDDLLTPGWVCYDDRQPYQTYKIADLLNEGENRIEIWLGDGWYRSPLMWKGAEITNCWGDQIGAIAQITNGQDIILKTDIDWFSGQLPILKSGIYFGETFDARLQNLDDNHGVELAVFDISLLVPHECRAVSKLAPLKPIKSFTDENGYIVYDFGQNVGGFVRFTVKGERGATIFVEHSEILGPYDEFDNRNLRSAECEILYTLSGEGEEVYEPYFTYQGFRYARVSIVGEAKIIDIQSIPISSLPDRSSSFESNNPLVNRLVENTVWSLRSNFIEVPTDCPQRDERLGWSGDAQIFASTACYLTDSHDFLRKYLKDLMADQRADGAISHVSPDPTRMQPDKMPNFVGSTGWGDAIVIIPWTLYNHYADKSILEDCYDAMCSWLDFVWSISDGPVVQPPVNLGDRGFSFSDWLQPKGESETPRPTISTDCAATIYHFISTNLLSRIAGVIGKPEDELKYSKRADQIRDAFANEFITPSGRIANSDQTTYSLAFLYDLIPAHHIQAAKHYFRKSIELTGGKIGTGFMGTPALLPALSKIGAYDLVSQVLLQKGLPGWLYQIEQGATTIWERWDAMGVDKTVFAPEMNSFNHYSYGAVCQWLFEGAAGFRSDDNQPGFENIIFEPVIIPALGPIEASHNSRTGEIKAHWRIEGDVVHYFATIPAGAQGEFRASEKYFNLKLDGKTVDNPDSFKLNSGQNNITFCIDY